MKNKLTAEFFGTFWLVFGGCGSAVLAAQFMTSEADTRINLGIGHLGVALAFGFSAALVSVVATGIGLSAIALSDYRKTDRPYAAAAVRKCSEIHPLAA